MAMAEKPRHRTKEDILRTFATNLHAARAARTQDAGRVHQTLFSRYENRHVDPRLTTIVKLAEDLEVPVSDLLKGL